MKYVDFVLDDYIDSVESYAENLNKELNSSESSKACAEHIMSWCEVNNHDLDTLPLLVKKCFIICIINEENDE